MSDQSPYGYPRVKVDDGGKEHPTLGIDVATAPIVREMFEGSTRGRPRGSPQHGTGSKFLFSGLLRCGHCDKPYMGQSAESGQFACYFCNTLHRGGK